MQKLITYDLREVRDYEDLYKEISSYQDAKRVLESVWMINSPLTCKEIADRLLSFIDCDDGLLVSECQNYAHYKLLKS